MCEFCKTIAKTDKEYFDYANKLISSYGTLFWNNERIEDSELYLDIREMLG